eukprot:COSAG01_NODE_2700_length_7232_cov_3.028876_2_plen_242_part_00
MRAREALERRLETLGAEAAKAERTMAAMEGAMQAMEQAEDERDRRRELEQRLALAVAREPRGVGEHGGVGAAIPEAAAGLAPEAAAEEEVEELVVTVQVLRARGLASMDRNGLADPYVRLRCPALVAGSGGGGSGGGGGSAGGAERRTRTVKKTLAPVWHAAGEAASTDGGESVEESRFRWVIGADEWREHVCAAGGAEGAGLLRAEVWDWDRIGKDEPMGACTVDLARCGGRGVTFGGRF